MIHRHDKCIGITLWRRKRKSLELWFCPSGAIILPHIHEHIDSVIIMLAGGMWGRIGLRSRYVGWRDIFRRFPVPRRMVHSAVINHFCLFANWESWDTDDVTSASEDFVIL